jgi:light-regulated signal transduction histidine kinase (bacteriophytochrome)
MACGSFPQAFFCDIFPHLSGWVPVYRLEGLARVLTALVSPYTAYTLIKILPRALLIPTPDDMDRKNNELLQSPEELKKKTDALAGQNESLGKLAFATYHDLREPVRGMSMNSQLLLHKYSSQLDDDAKTMLHHISDEGKRMYSSVDSILNFTFLESEIFISSRVSVNKVLAIVAKNLSQQIRDMYTSIQYSELPDVKGNERLLIILFENVLSNSIKFRSDQPPLIRIAATEGETFTTITIADNGTGFDNTYNERIFELCQRLGNVTSTYRGGGLWLALCRRITEIFGSSITAGSAPGMGTVITVMLTKA